MNDYIVLDSKLFNKIMEYLATKPYQEASQFFEAVKQGGALGISKEQLQSLEDKDEEAPE